jgi:hypothetical protein
LRSAAGKASSVVSGTPAFPGNQRDTDATGWWRYATACIATNGHLAEGFGLDQGFQHLDAPPPWTPFGRASEFYLRSGVAALAARAIGLPQRARLLPVVGEQIRDLAIASLDRMTGRRRPFFLILNYCDAHHPYIPPAPYDTRFPARDATQRDDLEARLIGAFTSGTPRITPRERAHRISQYDGSTAFLDSQIDGVLAALRKRGFYDRTLIIVAADHGESFGEHGAITHGLTDYLGVTACRDRGCLR